MRINLICCTESLLARDTLCLFWQPECHVAWCPSNKQSLMFFKTETQLTQFFLLWSINFSLLCFFALFNFTNESVTSSQLRHCKEFLKYVPQGLTVTLYLASPFLAVLISIKMPWFTCLYFEFAIDIVYMWMLWNCYQILNCAQKVVKCNGQLYSVLPQTDS